MNSWATGFSAAAAVKTWFEDAPMEIQSFVSMLEAVPPFTESMARLVR